MKEPTDATSTYVKLYDESNAANVHGLRDFLQRNVVGYQWIVIDDAATAQALLNRVLG